MALTARAVQALMSEWLAVIPLSLGFLVVLPLGWLTHTKFGVYNATKVGVIAIDVSINILR